MENRGPEAYTVRECDCSFIVNDFVNLRGRNPRTVPRYVILIDRSWTFDDKKGKKHALKRNTYIMRSRTYGAARRR